VGSVIGPENRFTRLYNPRIDSWHAHFRLDGPRIRTLTEIGEATVRLLRLNAPDRLLQRQTLQQIGAYPVS
jgi:hypothetical protein